MDGEFAERNTSTFAYCVNNRRRDSADMEGLKCRDCRWYVFFKKHCHESPVIVEKEPDDFCSRFREAECSSEIKESNLAFASQSMDLGSTIAGQENDEKDVNRYNYHKQKKRGKKWQMMSSIRCWMIIWVA